MHVDYETYASMSPLKRSQTRLSPENRADIVRTHWTRFLDASRERLSAEQIAFIEENLARIRPELYSEERKRTEAEFNQNREMEARFRQFFRARTCSNYTWRRSRTAARFAIRSRARWCTGATKNRTSWTRLSPT